MFGSIKRSIESNYDKINNILFFFNYKFLIFTDRWDLQDKDKVEELQSVFLHVLYKHLRRYRYDEPDLFSKLIKLIPTIQEINWRHSEPLNSIKMPQTTANNNNSTIVTNSNSNSNNNNKLASNKDLCFESPFYSQKSGNHFLKNQE